MDADESVWSMALKDFAGMIAAGDSITGAVAVSAVTARLAVSVLQMVLQVTARKENSDQIQAAIAAARNLSVQLGPSVDDDRAAYAAYRAALRLPKADEQRRPAVESALRRAIETPLAAAEAAAQALDLCLHTADMVHGAIAADVGGAAVLLSGAVRAVLLSVDANLATAPVWEELAAQRRELEERAVRTSEAVLRALAEKSKTPNAKLLTQK